MIDGQTDGHPVWSVMEYQGRTLAWLAKATGYSQSRVWAIKGGEPASPEFRRQCAAALGIPESLLFHPLPKQAADSTAA